MNSRLFSAHGPFPYLFVFLSIPSLPGSLCHLPLPRVAVLPAGYRLPSPPVCSEHEAVSSVTRSLPGGTAVQAGWIPNSQTSGFFLAILRVWAWLTASRLQAPSFAQLGEFACFPSLLLPSLLANQKCKSCFLLGHLRQCLASPMLLFIGLIIFIHWLILSWSHFIL